MKDFRFMNELGKQISDLRLWLKIRDELNDSRDYVEFNYNGKPYKLSYKPELGHLVLNDKQLVIETRRVSDLANEKYKVFNNYKELEDYVERAESKIAKTVRNYRH